MRKRQLAERHKRTKQLQKHWIEQNTIQSESANDGNEEVNQNPENPEGERREDKNQPDENNQQAEREEYQIEKRRGQSNRSKPNFFGNNIMVTQVSP